MPSGLRQYLALLALVLVILAGCGSDDNNGSSGGTFVSSSTNPGNLVTVRIQESQGRAFRFPSNIVHFKVTFFDASGHPVGGGQAARSTGTETDLTINGLPSGLLVMLVEAQDSNLVTQSYYLANVNVPTNGTIEADQSQFVSGTPPTSPTPIQTLPSPSVPATGGGNVSQPGVPIAGPPPTSGSPGSTPNPTPTPGSSPATTPTPGISPNSSPQPLTSPSPNSSPLPLNSPSPAGSPNPLASPSPTGSPSPQPSPSTGLLTPSPGVSP